MATATSTLITKPGARLAYVLEIEGHDVAYTDVPDLATWTGYTVRPGLRMRGSITRSLDLLGFDLAPVGFDFELEDAIPWSTSSSLAKLFAELDATAFVTDLQADLDRDDTTMTVRSTSLFPASGTLHMGHERMTYAGKTATTFTGLVRGLFPAGASSVASAGTWAHTHSIGADGLGPEVADKIRVWKNRRVAIYVVAVDPVTRDWNAKADALLEIVGSIEDYKPSGMTWSISCVSIEKRTQGNILRNQYVGAVRQGFFIGSTAKLKVFSANAENTTVFDELFIDVPAAYYTITTLIATINILIDAAAPTYDVGFALAGDRTSLGMSVTALGFYTSKVTDLNDEGRRVLQILGWPAGATVSGSVSAADDFSSLGPERAIGTFYSWNTPYLAVDRMSGEWANQSADDMPLGAGEGFVMIGDSQLASQVTYAGSAGGDLITWLSSYDLMGRPVSNTGLYNIVRYVGDDQHVAVKQVWIARGSVTRMLLRLLLSTGTANYNSATYDKWPSGMSCGIPSNFVDVASIEAIGEQLGAAGILWMVLTEPRSAVEEITSMMKTFGFHLIWRATGTGGTGGYKLVATVPTTISGLDTSHTLDTSNTGNDHYTETESGADLVVNRLTLRYNRDPATGDYMASMTYDNLASISEHDEPSALEHDALSLHDYDNSKIYAWRMNVAAPACAYFARPIRTHKRSGSRALWFLSVGDIVEFTDPDAPDAATGTYGTTSVKAWVTSVTKNYDTYELESITLIVPPSRSTRLSPTAMLDHTRGDKGYDSVNFRLYVKASEFTRASEADDVTWFYTNDVVDLVEIDPADPAAPTQWLALNVTGIGADYLQLSGALPAPAFDSTKRYYVVLSTYSDATGNPDRAVGAARSVAFMGDSVAGDLAGGAAPILWGFHLPATDAGAAPTGDEHYRRPWNLLDDDDGPLSSHFLRDLAYAVNNCYRHTTNQHPISDQFVAERTHNDVGWQTCGGPYKVFCPPGAESLTWEIDAAVIGAVTGSYRVTCGSKPPHSSSILTPSYDSDVSQSATGTTTSTTYVKVTGTVNVRPNNEGYTYVTFEFSRSGGTVKAHAVSAYFAARSLD